MPELPEIETIRLGLAPEMTGKSFSSAIIRCGNLRYPVPTNLPELLRGATIETIHRRSKYLCFDTSKGHLLIHLGMSGTLQLVPSTLQPKKHDHIDLILNNGLALRFRDPRRFGALVWTKKPIKEHKLLNHLGPEPLEGTFDRSYLWRVSRKRRVAIKPFIMNAKIVVGVGNIYASEVLWRARVHPKRLASRISKERITRITNEIKNVLKEAIVQGGTTLKDFRNSKGELGYFSQNLAVYGRAGSGCIRCMQPIKKMVLGNRSTFWCSRCQR